MPYPESGASYTRSPKFVADAMRAEGSPPLPPERPARYDLRTSDGLADAQQKLNEIGLGRAVTVAPSAAEKE